MTFDLNSDYVKLLKSTMDAQKHQNRKKFFNQKSFSLIACKLIIRKKLVKNENLNRKSRPNYINIIAYQRT